MVLKLYNTLTRKKEIFKPIKNGQVGMYACGPTVYNYAHIGNFRTYVFSDVLKRILKYNKFKVNHVMNITDVDDKTLKGSKEAGENLKTFTRKYEKIFIEDLKSMNIEKPSHILRATESIREMVKIIERLLDKKYAYKTSDGIYFSISKFKNYSKLARLEKIKKTQSRVTNDEYDKSNAKDFALWKFHTKADGDVFWNAPFGKGRPGWHIECSAMSMKVLGESFDIHTGGSDLIFPHHTNEIAQSEAATGKRFVKYWIHGAFLNMGKNKMSKSLGNILNLRELIKKGFSGEDYRYLILTTHYRKPLNFSIKNLKAAQNSLQRLKNIISGIKDDKKKNNDYLKRFEEEINNDLDTGKALQVLWNLVRNEKARGKLKTIKEMDEIFGLNLLKKDNINIPSNVKKLAEEREKSRKKKDWKKADELRDKITKLKYSIEDKDKGYVLKKN